MEITQKLTNLENLVKELTMEKLENNKENEISRSNMAKKPNSTLLNFPNDSESIDIKIQKAVNSALQLQNLKFDQLQEDYENKGKLLDAYDEKLEIVQNQKMDLQEENLNLKTIINEYELETQNLKNLIGNMENELDVVEELRAENQELISAVKEIEEEMNITVKESAEYKDLELRLLDMENENTVLKNQIDA